MGPTPEERDLVDRARLGDRQAFRVLVELNQTKIFRLAMRVLHCDRDTADDICQEVFLRAFRGLAKFDGKVKFATWLHTIAMHASITEYRRQRAQKRARPTFSLDAPIGGAAAGGFGAGAGGSGGDGPSHDPAAREVSPLDRADQREFAVAVRRAIDELPEEYREAVILRDLQGLSYEEIEVILKVALGTVRSRIHRGRTMLQKKLRGFV